MHIFKSYNSPLAAMSYYGPSMAIPPSSGFSQLVFSVSNYDTTTNGYSGGFWRVPFSGKYFVDVGVTAQNTLMAVNNSTLWKMRIAVNSTGMINSILGSPAFTLVTNRVHWVRGVVSCNAGDVISAEASLSGAGTSTTTQAQSWLTIQRLGD